MGELAGGGTMAVDVWKTCFPVDERLLVEDCIANNFLLFLLVFTNQPAVHSGGVSRGKACGWLQVTSDT